MVPRSINMDDDSPESQRSLPLDGKFSCQACHKRKVRCDRKQPCSTCQKGNVECIYLAPPPPRRRKRVADKDLLAKLKRYEDHLKRAGIAIEDEAPGSPSEADAMDDVRSTVDPSQESNGKAKASSVGPLQGNMSTSSASSPPQQLLSQHELRFQAKATGGRFITDHSGKSRYLDNNLWVTLNDELRDPDSMVQIQEKDCLASDDDASIDAEAGILLFSRPSSDRELRRQYPLPAVADVLWQTYIRNVNPLVKTLHVPTFQKLIDHAKTNLATVSKGELALLFAVFHFGVSAIDAEDFDSIFPQPKDFLLKHFRNLTQNALVNASFLKSSDDATLQAYLHYILSTRAVFDSQTTWTLSGVGFRIAQRMGIHRDGEGLGLSPFQTEIRRRLWLQLIILDHTSSELAGSTSTFWNYISDFWDTKRPLNINDADFGPSSTEFPAERTGATEMIFCLLRFEFGESFRRHRKQIRDSYEGKVNYCGQPSSIKDKDSFIDGLQQKLEQGYVRYCDPIEPLHYLCMLAARSAVSGMRLRGHHPRQYSDHGASLPQEEKDLLFDLGLKVIQYDNLIHSTPSLRIFRWHIRAFFQWHAFIYILSDLRYRRIGVDADRGWKEVAGVYSHHPDFIENRRHVLHVAVSSLTLKAWDGHEIECRKQGINLEVPGYIQAIRAVSSSSKAVVTKLDEPDVSNRDDWTAVQMQLAKTNQGTGVTWWSGIMDANNSNSSSSIGEPTPIDWTQWDNLVEVGNVYQDFFDFDSLHYRGQGQ